MRLLEEFETAFDADIASSEYREKGILTHVSSRHSNGLRFITGAMNVGLWVVLDEQFEDAIALKGNPSHRPSFTLSEDEMAELEALGRDYFDNSGAKILSVVGYSAAVVVLVGYILYVSYGLLNPS